MTRAIQASLFALLLAVLVPLQSLGAEIVGGDAFEADADATISGTQARDAFVAGFSASLDGTIAGDGHAAGFDVNIDGSIGGDLYVAGASVGIGARVGEDLTASGFSVRLLEGGRVEGNARLMAGSVRVEGPIAGSLMATGGSVTLDAPVSGDVNLSGGSLTFGDDARIGGTLVYAAPEEIDIPESVISADRVRFVELSRFDGFEQMRDAMEDPQQLLWPSLVAVIGGFVITLAFLLVVAAVFLAFLPRRVEEGHQVALAKPGLVLLSGFLAMALLFGLVPVSAMTLIGAPFVPIVFLLIVASWVAAYLLGTYTLSLRLGGAFGAEGHTNAAKLALLAVGLVVLAILNFVPFLGWMINLAVVLLGAGAIALMIVGRIDCQGLLPKPTMASSDEQLLPGIEDDGDVATDGPK
jgi:cytoskeletal protein CcmA (bactofilin family)